MPYRYKLLIEFDGTNFVGWQRQDNGPSIQSVIERAIFDFCGDKTFVFGAGRTDAGVHAMGMVGHVDLSKSHEPFKIRDAINAHLKPSAIAVLEVEAVSDDFHARFSAIARHYLYRFVGRRPPLVLDKMRAWRVTGPLDHEAMNLGAQYLVGKHDFSTFRAAQCQSRSPVKSLSEIQCTRVEDLIELRVSAPSFLHHQVRSIAGSLVMVGKGKWEADYIQTILDASDRSLCGQVAPACGLYFVKADYPPED